MRSERVVLAPARPSFSVAGWVGLAFDVGALLLALLFVPRPWAVLGLFALNAAMSSAIALVTWRRGLRRVVAPVPERAVVVPPRFTTARLVGSVLATATTLGCRPPVSSHQRCWAPASAPRSGCSGAR